MIEDRCDVVVVGAGLAGFAAAATAARAGRRVILLDARSIVGGRARTDVVDGFALNQGPHALYRGGAGWGVLRELGVRPSGGSPSYRRPRWLRGGELVGVRRALPPRALRDLLRAIGAGGADLAAGRSTSEWIDACSSTDAGRAALGSLVRLTTYAADHDHLDAAATRLQLRRAARGVVYLHGGWQQLVDGLAASAAAAGVTVRTGARAHSVEVDPTGARVVVDDRAVVAAAVVLSAGGAPQAAALLHGASPIVDRWAAGARPVHAACLDVGLTSLPARHAGPVVGLDEGWYVIPHTPSANLAPASGHVIHAMRYLRAAEVGTDHRPALEGVLDLIHPTWRDRLATARVGRSLVVAPDVPRVGVDAADRPSHAVADLPGAFVAGDWITADGMLADAALASGRSAGLAAAAHRSTVTAVPA